MKYQEVYSEYSSLTGLTPPSGDFLRWINTINRYFYDRFCDIEPERFVAEQSYTLNNTEQDLPTDFWKMNDDCHTGIFFVNDNGTAYRRLEETSWGTNVQGYYLKESTIKFTGYDSSGTQTVVMRYLPYSVVITDTNKATQNLYINDRYKEELFMVISRFDAIDGGDYNLASGIGANKLQIVEQEKQKAMDEIFRGFTRKRMIIAV